MGFVQSIHLHVKTKQSHLLANTASSKGCGPADSLPWMWLCLSVATVGGGLSHTYSVFCAKPMGAPMAADAARYYCNAISTLSASACGLQIVISMLKANLKRNAYNSGKVRCSDGSSLVPCWSDKRESTRTWSDQKDQLLVSFASFQIKMTWCSSSSPHGDFRIRACIWLRKLWKILFVQ